MTITRTLPRALAVLTLAVGPAAQALTLDTFLGEWHTAQYDSALPSATVLRSDGVSWLPGVTRTLQIAPEIGQPGSMLLDSRNDRLLYRGLGGQTLSASLSYGLDRPMDLDLSGEFGFVLHHGFTMPYKLTVYAWTQAPVPGDNPLGSAINVDVGMLFQGGVLLPLSAFYVNDGSGQGVNWADVDSLSFVFSAPAAGTGVQGDLLFISTVAMPVPEPAAWALWLAGAGLLAARRGIRRGTPG